MPDRPPDPSALMDLATGYWASATLLAANDMRLFAALAEGPLTAEAVAGRLQTAPRATAMLLDACVGLGLLMKEAREGGVVYRNTPEADAFLTPGRPGYMGSALRWAADQYVAWGRLAESVRTDTPAVRPTLHLGDDPAQTRHFVLGMHNRALGIARGVVPFLDFRGAENLLDVGGGPGTYAVLLAQNYPDLRVTVLDLPPVVAIARELISEAGMADRVQVQAGDAVADDYGEGAFDAVLFSGVLHQMSPPTIQAMLGKAQRALKPGGRVALCDMMLDATKTQPPFAALFSLQMLLTSAEGAVFSVEEGAIWLSQAGFSQIEARPLPPPLPYTILTGKA